LTFKNRETNVSMNWKKLTSAELNETFQNAQFKTQPYFHQLVTFTFVLSQNLNRVLLIHDIGLGKTLTSLYLLKLWNVKSRTLVICPNSVIKTWKGQIKLHTNFTYCVLKGSKKERIYKITNEKADIFIINYEGLKLIGGEKTGKSYRPNDKQIQQIPFECIIADECHRFKALSLQTRIARLFSKRSRYSILMTGTPIGKNTQDLFGQCLVLDNGLTFGQSYSYFLNHFFYKKFKQDFDWTPKRICGICDEMYTKKTEHLRKHDIDIIQYKSKYPNEKTSEFIILDTIKKFSLTYKRDECLNLPDKIYEERSVYPTVEQQKWTQDIMNEIKIDEIGTNIEQHVTKLLQITGGTLIYDNNMHKIFNKNPKLDELLLLMQAITGKVIVYHYYFLECEIIRFALNKKGFKTSILNGHVKDRDEQIDSFLKNGDVLIAHPKSGGEGLNLQEANTIIFFSNSFIGTILREQAEGRIHRTGQTKSCLYLDIIMENTIDRILYNSLKNKTNHVQNILKYLRKIRINC